MVESSIVSEVCSINGELIKSVQLRLHGVIARPRIAAAAFEHEHAMIDSRAIERAECINLGGWRVWHSVSVAFSASAWRPYRC